MKVSARSAGGQVCVTHLARFRVFFGGIKIAGEKPAVPQFPKTDAIWGVAVLGSTETLESSTEKTGFCRNDLLALHRHALALNPCVIAADTDLKYLATLGYRDIFEFRILKGSLNKGVPH